ncbi:PH domain-containing protein [Geodermatophilus sp. SYSU D01186]
MAKLDKLIEQAREHLEPGEVIKGAVQGTYETKIMGSETVRTGILVATDRRVVFYAKKFTGYDLESFPYGNISSFEQGKNMMGHNITFYASGNRVHVKWIPTDENLVRLTEEVKAAMNAKHVMGQPAPQVAAPQPDIMGQLKQLGELRDAGILTQEEFDTKKAELLARL